jgi:hypothetical protein
MSLPVESRGRRKIRGGGGVPPGSGTAQDRDRPRVIPGAGRRCDVRSGGRPARASFPRGSSSTAPRPAVTPLALGTGHSVPSQPETAAGSRPRHEAAAAVPEGPLPSRRARLLAERLVAAAARIPVRRRARALSGPAGRGRARPPSRRGPAMRSYSGGWGSGVRLGRRGQARARGLPAPPSSTTTSTRPRPAGRACAEGTGSPPYRGLTPSNHELSTGPCEARVHERVQRQPANACSGPCEPSPAQLIYTCASTGIRLSRRG